MAALLDAFSVQADANGKATLKHGAAGYLDLIERN
jgi:hypothetical protein